MATTETPSEQRFMVLGSVGFGKTTLLRALEGAGEAARKTQMVDYAGWGIDTPGEYSEMGMFRNHLITTANDASVLLVIQDATRARSSFPPGFFLMFSQTVIGLVTKIDRPDADIAHASRLLRDAGVRGDIYPVSAVEGTGIEELRQRLLALGLVHHSASNTEE
ncbi:ethanolamine utilization protein EutP [Rhodopseudomonas julia]|uniref:Ethanolamine utilization protein EutP n=1 Tax=Rhodopseudomonas julia TaxID=200617 RepID=A0ABU0CCH9_9BRAD|nr:EutP/PduV family microcompartment system protein [Rhodopseudomonas julia]MDQ0327651.1 ethanolamine utilization protein EutP [Rhodopseudomonas julia]